MKAYIKAIIRLIFLIIICYGLLNSCQRNPSEKDSQTVEEKSYVKSENSLLKIEEETSPRESADKYVVEEDPLAFDFDENENLVGNCTVKLLGLELVNRGVNEIYVRIYATLRNNSENEIYVNSRKPGSFRIGKYYLESEEIFIGWNDNYKWKTDNQTKPSFDWTLAAHEEKTICVTGAFFCSEKIRYTDVPRIDLYFTCDDEFLTIPINE